MLPSLTSYHSQLASSSTYSQLNQSQQNNHQTSLTTAASSAGTLPNTKAETSHKSSLPVAVKGSWSVASLKSLASMAAGKRQCRYCLLMDDVEKLCKSRCQCAGTMSYVHDKCLVESRKKNPKLPRGNCEICNWPFEPRLPRVKNRRSQITRCITLGTVGSVLLIAAVVLLLADYVNEKMLMEKNYAEDSRLSRLHKSGGGVRKQNTGNIASNSHRVFPAAASAAKPTDHSLSNLLSSRHHHLHQSGVGGGMAAEKRLLVKVFVLAVASVALGACSWTYAKCRRIHGCMELQSGIVASAEANRPRPQLAFQGSVDAGHNQGGAAGGSAASSVVVGGLDCAIGAPLPVGV